MSERAGEDGVLMGRCEATREQNPGTTILGPVLGPQLDQGMKVTLRCRGEQGHDDNHWATVCPFPGFADEVVRW